MTRQSASEVKERASSRFPARELVKAVLMSLAATCLFVFLFMNPWRHKKPELSGGVGRVLLIQKDAEFKPVPRERGGASGSVWYKAAGPAFSFQLRADGLTPGKRYLIELGVDDKVFDIASHAADSRGAIALDTALSQFAEGACVGTNYIPPLPLAGKHEIKFLVKRDGNPPSGTGRTHTPEVREGADLPCSGNGDNDYTYALFENDIAHYDGGK
jgi:hypothetical protein